MVKDWQNEWFTAEELLHMGDTQRQPDSIDSLCPEGQGVLILGPESCQESSTAVELAVAMSTGEDWYGIQTKPLTSLYIFFEGEPGELADKVGRARQKYSNADLKKVIFKHFDDLPFDTNTGKTKLDALIQSLPWPPDCLFYDPYRGCIEGEENDTKPAKNVVKNISSYHKSRHFLIHHRSKPGNEPRTLGGMARGSAVLGQWAHSLGHLGTKKPQTCL